MATDGLLHFIQCFKETIYHDVEIIKNFKIILRNVFEKTKYSHCHSMCVTYRCSLTSTVVVLLTEIGGITVHLEQLSRGRKFLQCQPYFTRSLHATLSVL
jgi:hypothetical protein